MNFSLLREIYIFMSLHLKLLDHHHPELCIFLFVDGSKWFNITTKWVKLRQKMAFTFFPETCPWIFWFLDSNYRRWILKKYWILHKKRFMPFGISSVNFSTDLSTNFFMKRLPLQKIFSSPLTHIRPLISFDSP